MRHKVKTSPRWLDSLQLEGISGLKRKFSKKISISWTNRLFVTKSMYGKKYYCFLLEFINTPYTHYDSLI